MDPIYLKLNKGNGKPKSPVLLLSVTAYKKITYWTKIGADAGLEVSGLGVITPCHNGLYVSDAWLMKPKRVGGAHVDMDPASIYELMMELMVKGRNMRNLRFLWHTHADFAVGWSGTDDRTARHDFCPDAKWTVNLVTNSKGHFLARQDFPKSKNETIHDLPVRLLLGIPSNQCKKYKEQYKEGYPEKDQRSFKPSIDPDDVFVDQTVGKPPEPVQLHKDHQSMEPPLPGMEKPEQPKLFLPRYEPSSQ